MNQQSLVVFPGQGSQFSGMGRVWFDNFQIYREFLEEASDAASLNLKKLSLDTLDFDLKDTTVAQPLILAVSLGIWRVILSLAPLIEKARPIFAGHSLGEYSALAAAGALDAALATALVQQRGQFMKAACPTGLGSMRALILKEETPREKIEEFCAYVSKRAKLVSFANWNTDVQIVVAGYAEGLALVDELAGEGEWSWIRRSIPLEVSGPFHSPLIEPAGEQLGQLLQETSFNPVPYNYYPNFTAAKTALNHAETLRKNLVEQVSGLVQWYPTLCSAKEVCSHHIEIGPGKVLTNMAARAAKLKDWNYLYFETPFEVEEKMRNAFG